MIQNFRLVIFIWPMNGSDGYWYNHGMWYINLVCFFSIKTIPVSLLEYQGLNHSAPNINLDWVPNHWKCMADHHSLEDLDSYEIIERYIQLLLGMILWIHHDHNDKTTSTTSSGSRNCHLQTNPLFYTLNVQCVQINAPVSKPRLWTIG